jgi:glycerol-3-phosphate dehydrogenase subunit B
VVSGTNRLEVDVAVVGAGMAGMAAALGCAERGLSCAQVGDSGGILFASGLLDLLAVHPVGDPRPWPDPFRALAALARDDPEHPLARAGEACVRDAFEAFVAALGAAGLRYAAQDGVNRGVPTSVGTIKTSYALPQSMRAGADALAARVPCLLVDFRGLREYSAQQIVATLGPRWPGLSHRRVELPGCEAAAELYAAHVARSLDDPATRTQVIGLVAPRVGDARAVGFPAVLGLARSSEVHAAFEAALGVPVFEVPTMPTSVPGLRLRAALEAAVAARGIVRRHRASVARLAFEGDHAVLDLDDGVARERVVARAVVLATGRFSGRGLVADRTGVREAILGLPVEQPASREAWHSTDFLDPRGHPVNRAGLRTDAEFRPIDTSGRAAWPRLYAAGSILAGQDWVREKCGTGLAIATARAAVARAAHALGAGVAEAR